MRHCSPGCGSSPVPDAKEKTGSRDAGAGCLDAPLASEQSLRAVADALATFWHDDEAPPEG